MTVGDVSSGKMRNGGCGTADVGCGKVLEPEAAVFGVTSWENMAVAILLFGDEALRLW